MQEFDEVQFTELLNRHVAPTFERLQQILGLEVIHQPSVQYCELSCHSFIYPQFNMAMITRAGLRGSNYPRNFDGYELGLDELMQFHLVYYFTHLILKQVNNHEFFSRRQAIREDDPQRYLISFCQVNALALLAWHRYIKAYQIKDPAIDDPSRYLALVSENLGRALRHEAALNNLDTVIIVSAITHFYSALFFDHWFAAMDTLDFGQWLKEFDLEKIPDHDINWAKFELEDLRARFFYLNPKSQFYEM